MPAEVGTAVDQKLTDYAAEQLHHSVHSLNEARVAGAEGLADSGWGDANRIDWESARQAREIAEEREARDREYAKAYEKFIGPAAPGTPVYKQRYPDVPAPPEPQRGRYVAF